MSEPEGRRQPQGTSNRDIGGSSLPPLGPTPDGPDPPEKEGYTPRDLEQFRREWQAFLGELHGLLTTGFEHLRDWCPPDLQGPMREAFAQTHQSFGVAQASMNTGKHDTALPLLGLDPVQGAPKLTGFRKWKADFYDAIARAVKPIAERFDDALRWSLVPLETLAGEIPGGTAIKELCLTIRESIADFRKLQT